ncbi:MAG: hypothetical protein ABIL09_26560 [Gemmatimonadota bacterium]
MGGITPEEYRRRLDRLTEIFGGMVEHADAQSRTRCPYRDRRDQCTALFRCRNQVARDGAAELARCGHDGALDYRSAWESDPASVDRARQRLERTRREAAAQRGREPG